MEERALAFKSPYKVSAMHHRHLALGATMVEVDQWRRPERYTSSEEELGAIHQGVGLCDISPVGKLIIQGRDIESFLGKTFSSAPKVGRIEQQALSSSDDSTPVEVMACRLCDDEVLIISASDKVRSVAQELEEGMSECVHLVDMTSALAGLNIVGPNSRDTLAKLTELDLSPVALPNLSCVQGSVAEVHATLMRHDGGGESGYEIYFGRDLGEHVWDAIMEAGEEFQIRPFGLAALQELRSGG